MKQADFKQLLALPPARDIPSLPCSETLKPGLQRTEVKGDSPGPIPGPAGIAEEDEGWDGRQVVDRWIASNFRPVRVTRSALRLVQCAVAVGCGQLTDLGSMVPGP